MITVSSCSGDGRSHGTCKGFRDHGSPSFRFRPLSRSVERSAPRRSFGDPARGHQAIAPGNIGRVRMIWRTTAAVVVEAIDGCAARTASAARVGQRYVKDDALEGPLPQL